MARVIFETLVTLNGAIQIPGEGNDYVLDQHDVPHFKEPVRAGDVVQVISLSLSGPLPRRVFVSKPKNKDGPTWEERVLHIEEECELVEVPQDEVRANERIIVPAATDCPPKESTWKCWEEPGQWLSWCMTCVDLDKIEEHILGCEQCAETLKKLCKKIKWVK